MAETTKSTFPNMHNAKIIRAVQLSDGEIAILARCCDDPSTDSWHTMKVTPTLDLAASKTSHCSRVGELHTHMSKISLEDLIDK